MSRLVKPAQPAATSVPAAAASAARSMAGPAAIAGARDRQADLTGLFWTKLCEKVSLERSFGHAEEEVQCGADYCAAASEVLMSQGKAAPVACREAGISQQSYYRWRKEYGGLELDQAKRMKDLERENIRLKRLVADLSLEKQVLKDVASGNL